MFNLRYFFAIVVIAILIIVIIVALLHLSLDDYRIKLKECQKLNKYIAKQVEQILWNMKMRQLGP